MRDLCHETNPRKIQRIKNNFLPECSMLARAIYTYTHTFVKNNKRLKPVRDEIQLIDECDDVEGEDRDLGNRRLEYSMGLFFYRYTHAWRDVQ